MPSFTIQASNLRKLAARINLVVEKKVTTPILSTANLSWGDGVVKAIGTDLDCEIQVTEEAETEGAERIQITATHLIWAGRAGGDGKVCFETIGPKNPNGPPRLRITAADMIATLNLIYPVEDFPIFQHGELFGPVQASQADWRRLLIMGRSAISTEETRYYLNGTYIHGIDGNIRAVSTDGHRLARIDSEIPWPDGAVGDAWKRVIWQADKKAEKKFAHQGIILPTRLINALSHLIYAKGNAPVGMWVNTTRVRFQGEGWSITSKVVDGTYPDYTHVVPVAEATSHMNLSLVSLRRIAASPFQSYMVQVIAFDLAEKRATIKSNDLDGEISMPIEASGAIIQIGFNSRYVVDIARAMGGSIRFDMTSNSDPARVYGEDPNAVFVLMPMRV